MKCKYYQVFVIRITYLYLNETMLQSLLPKPYTDVDIETLLVKKKSPRKTLSFWRYRKPRALVHNDTMYYDRCLRKKKV